MERERTFNPSACGSKPPGSAYQGVPFISQTAGLAIVVLPEDVGLAVAVEVAGRLDVPSGAGIGPTAARVATVVPFISQIAAWPLSFCHRMSALPSPLKSPAPLTCQEVPGLAPARAR